MAERHPIFAWSYDTFMAPLERLMLGRERRALLRGVSGRVLELGVGSGFNLAHYGSEARVIAVDRDPCMIERARRKVGKSDARIELMLADAEALPFGSSVFDSVVSTLVFCTIPRPGRAAQEISRVLKPGGRFYFLEHIRSDIGLLAGIQDLVEPVWSSLFAGCQPNRDTVALFKSAGFEFLSLRISVDGIWMRGEAVPRPAH